jgi:hypothetical protein
MRQVDEWARVVADLPPREATVRLAVPVPGRLRDLKPIELDVLQLAISYARVEHILDQSEHEDSATGAALSALLSAGVLTTS